MIAFIFFIIVVTLMLLILAFTFELYPLGMISSMAMIIIGVYVLSNGVENIDNILTLALGIVCVCVGSYILINGSLEQLQEINTEGIKW
jgi:hypothetical protein